MYGDLLETDFDCFASRRNACVRKNKEHRNSQKCKKGHYAQRRMCENRQMQLHALETERALLSTFPHVAASNCRGSFGPCGPTSGLSWSINCCVKERNGPAFQKRTIDSSEDLLACRTLPRRVKCWPTSASDSLPAGLLMASYPVWCKCPTCLCH